MKAQELKHMARLAECRESPAFVEVRAAIGVERAPGGGEGTGMVAARLHKLTAQQYRWLMEGQLDGQLSLLFNEAEAYAVPPGAKKTSQKPVLIPAKAVLRREVYYTCACENCEKNDISTPVLKTPKEPSVIPGSFASPEVIAHIIAQKFVMASPLYRQEQEWDRAGLKLSRQTMSSWVLRAAERLTPDNAPDERRAT